MNLDLSAIDLPGVLVLIHNGIWLHSLSLRAPGGFLTIIIILFFLDFALGWTQLLFITQFPHLH